MSSAIKIIAGGTAAALLTIAPFACSTRLRVVRYPVYSQKVQKPLRLALISDFHSNTYGENQQELLTALFRQRPDAVLLGGDIAEDRKAHGPALLLMQKISERLPAFYVTGNHEIWSGNAPWLKKQFRDYGVTVLQGDCHRLTFRGQSLLLCGVDDPAIGRLAHLRQLRRAAGCTGPGSLSVLLAHRPEYGPFYALQGFDLILSGHAHGGQWRLPGLINGVYCMEQGLFPQYAGGRYDFGQSTLLVGRGLARESQPVPRIFNRPELVLVDILPDKRQNHPGKK